MRAGGDRESDAWSAALRPHRECGDASGFPPARHRHSAVAGGAGTRVGAELLQGDATDGAEG